MKSLDVRAVIRNLEKLYNTSSTGSKKSKDKSRQELAAELELFFGPSKIFVQIFKLAMLKTFDNKKLQKDEEEKILRE